MPHFEVTVPMFGIVVSGVIEVPNTSGAIVYASQRDWLRVYEGEGGLWLAGSRSPWHGGVPKFSFDRWKFSPVP